MEFRLNKLISEQGICSRREADKLIETTDRVTVNGKRARVGDKVTPDDIVEVDGERIPITRQMIEEAEAAAKERAALDEIRIPAKDKTKGNFHEKYGKYNKYAAARHAAKEGGTDKKPGKKIEWEKVRQSATAPKFGKSLSRSAIAQRMASSPKSAALRKTSRNNPLNKAKRSSGWKDK